MTRKFLIPVLVLIAVMMTVGNIALATTGKPDHDPVPVCEDPPPPCDGGPCYNANAYYTIPGEGDFAISFALTSDRDVAVCLTDRADQLGIWYPLGDRGSLAKIPARSIKFFAVSLSPVHGTGLFRPLRVPLKR